MAKNNKSKNFPAYKSLQKKQMADLLCLAIALGVVYAIAENTTLSEQMIGIVLILIFVILLVILEGTRRFVKISIQKTMDEIMQEATVGTKKIEITMDNQKDNINSSVLKLINIKNSVKSVKEYIESLNELINHTKEKTEQSLDFTNTENLAVKANIEKMFTLRHKIQTIAELILELSDYIQSIASTVGVVEDITEQTNLLALNAAVEAARAGEHGKGFAVVAGEIRKLADESKQATATISSLVSDIQQATNSTVMATEEGTKEIESGINLANSIGENIEQLIVLMNEVSQNAGKISQSWKKIEQDTNLMDNDTNELNEMLEENHKITDENHKNVETLNALAKTYSTFVDEE